MTFPTYQSGTVSVSANGTVVTGSETLWDRRHARAGDLISIDGLPWVPIMSVDGVDALTIPEWQGGAQTDAAYIILNSSIDRVLGPLAFQDLARVVNALNSDGFYVFVGPDETAPDKSDGYDGQYARQPTTGKEWVKIDAEWTYLGVSAPLSFSDEAWSPLVSYGQRVIVRRAGRLWLSLQASNLNNPPESSPLWWQEFMSGGDAVYIAFDDPARPGSGEEVLKYVTPQPMTIIAGMVDSRAHTSTAATAESVYSIRKNGVEFATLTFAVGAVVGAFACANDVIFAAGDILSVVAPNPRDDTMATIATTLVAYR